MDHYSDNSVCVCVYDQNFNFKIRRDNKSNSYERRIFESVNNNSLGIRVVESESGVGGVGGVACFQLESESVFKNCWSRSRFFKTAGVGVGSRSRFFKTAGVGVGTFVAITDSNVY